jgi:hypothetical protein
MGYERQADFGTPEVASAETVRLTIDGRDVTVPAGTSVMRAAALSGGSIPKLCASDNLAAFGSCRLCLVEIDGVKGTPASCTTPATEGMAVRTQTPRLQRLRRGVMELYISDHPLDCLTCSANNDCELQDQAAAVGLRDVRYGYQGENHLAQPVDASNPYFDFDPSKCIVCSRCVRACDEVQGTFVLTIDWRVGRLAPRLAAAALVGRRCTDSGVGRRRTCCISPAPRTTGAADRERPRARRRLCSETARVAARKPARSSNAERPARVSASSERYPPHLGLLRVGRRSAFSLRARCSVSKTNAMPG